MAREKEGYRDMLYFLSEVKKLPLAMNKGQVCDALNVSREHLSVMISKGHIKVVDSKIPIGSVANYLCG